MKILEVIAIVNLSIRIINKMLNYKIFWNNTWNGFMDWFQLKVVGRIIAFNLVLLQ